jgi:hypothetical protein
MSDDDFDDDDDAPMSLEAIVRGYHKMMEQFVDAMRAMQAELAILGREVARLRALDEARIRAKHDNAAPLQ